MNEYSKILIVEDDLEIAQLMSDYLRRENYEVLLVSDGQTAVSAAREYQPDCIILDIMLPKLDGFEVCRILRAEMNVPILMVSARADDIDKILGLGLGADDYIAKPFSPSFLVAKVKAQLRRHLQFYQQEEQTKANGSKMQVGNLEIDLDGYEVLIHQKSINLSSREFELLKFFALHPGQVFSREQIYDRVWGYGDFGDVGTVTVHIKRLRDKIETPDSEVKITTVWGVGYKFVGTV